MMPLAALCFLCGLVFAIGWIVVRRPGLVRGGLLLVLVPLLSGAAPILFYVGVITLGDLLRS